MGAFWPQCSMAVDMKGDSMKKRFIFIAICLSFLFIVPSLYAGKSVSLQQIMVTAQKQDENYRDIPISLTIFDEFDIEDRGFEEITDLADQSSNFTIFDAGGTGMVSPFIRGIASDNGVESANAGVYVDGIPYVHTFGNDIFLENIKRIEVLKGPQSVLYGKNSYAGVVNIISREPCNDMEGNAGIRLGSDNARKYHIFLNAPVIKNTLMMNAFFHHYEKDGFIKNSFLNTEDNFHGNRFGKVHVLFVPNPSLKLSLISSFLDKNNGAPHWNIDHTRHTASNIQGVNDTDSVTNALKMDYDFGTMKISSVTTMKSLDNRVMYDADFSPANAYHVDADMEVREYSQEIRCSGKNRYFEYLAGVYADTMSKDRLLKINGNGFQEYRTRSNTFSFFANIDWEITQDLSLSLGGRLDQDRICLDDDLSGIEDKNSYTNLSPKISLTYHVLPNTMLYGTISRGYKSGGYYMFAPSVEQRWVDKEAMTNYEMGVKSYPTKNLSLGASVFFMKIKDKQVTTHLDPFASYVDNAASSKTRGCEVDLDYAFTRQLHVSGSLGFNDSEFILFEDSQGNYSGNQNPFSPRFTYALCVRYRGDNGVFALVNLRGQDKFYTDKQNLFVTDGFYLMDAKLGYEKEHYEIYLYARNLMDKTYDIAYGMSKFLSPPRELGVQFRYRF